MGMNSLNYDARSRFQSLLIQSDKNRMRTKRTRTTALFIMHRRVVVTTKKPEQTAQRTTPETKQKITLKTTIFEPSYKNAPYKRMIQWSVTFAYAFVPSF